MTPVSHDASERMEDRLRKLEKINRALMGRVERSTDFSGNGFSLFQTAILLEGQVSARTGDLKRTLEDLSDAYARLEDARDDAETAKQNLTSAIEPGELADVTATRRTRPVSQNAGRGG